MSTETLPTITRAEFESYSSKDCCYVSIDRKIYDVASFVEVHPGGADLILKYAGRDVGDILRDPASHAHSEATYNILEEYLIGYMALEKKDAVDCDTGTMTEQLVRNPTSVVGQRPFHARTGMSCEEDLSKDTDLDKDFQTHKFLNLNHPLFPQIWYGGFTKRFYLDQIHRPRHYKGGKPAPLFGNFLEPFSRTPWWMVPGIWMPFITYGTYIASQGFSNYLNPACYFGFGFFLWSFIEYCLHRFLFHLDYYLPDHRIAISMHFLLHGFHHYLPMDKDRLVMPPALLLLLATPFWYLAHGIFTYSWHAATTVFCGGLFGYVSYDLTHYFLHHARLPLWYKELKKYHLAHHFLDYELAYGVTSKLWDRVFGTELHFRTKTA